METRTKVVLGLGALGLLILAMRGSGGGRSVQVIGQAFNPDGSRAPWAPKSIGFSNKTIGAKGCVLTTLNMAWNAFNPDAPFTPDTLNDFLKEKGAFQGADLLTEVAAGALGMIKPHNERIDFSGQGKPTAAHLEAMCAALDLALSRGGLGFLRVDNNQDLGLDGDHTMLAFAGSRGSGYQCADPALATLVTLDGNLFGSVRNKFGAHFLYQGVGVSPLYNT